MTDPTPANPLADELRLALAELGEGELDIARQRLERLAEHVERLGADDATATLDVATSGLDPDQEIRARALKLAIDAIARIPSHAGCQPLAQAGQYAEWIRSGWPRMDGNDGCPHHQPPDDGSTR